MDQESASRLEHLRKRLDRLRTRLRIAGRFAGGLLLALAAVFLFYLLVPGARPLSPRQVNDLIARAMASATPPLPFAVHAYQAVQPSLVLIETQILGTEGKSQGSLGSGVVLDETGDILTSLHVVRQAFDIQVTYSDGTQSSASVTASQPENDIAVLRAVHPPAHLVPATLGDPHSLQIGDDAFVVGNPLGLYGSLSRGVISGLNRPFQQPNGGPKLQGLIQFDAAVNPGNSGGPLVNRDGEVVGIVTGLANPTGQDAFAGIGFAVPINVAASAAGSPPD